MCSRPVAVTVPLPAAGTVALPGTEAAIAMLPPISKSEKVTTAATGTDAVVLDGPRELVTTPGCKRQSTPDKRGHYAKHVPWRVWGG